TARKCLLSSRPQVRILLGAQFTTYFLLLSSRAESRPGGQSPDTSRGECRGLIQSGRTRSEQRACRSGAFGRFQGCGGQSIGLSGSCTLASVTLPSRPPDSSP